MPDVTIYTTGLCGFCYRAKALLEGRLSPSVSDVVSLAPAILRHRMDLSFAARAEGRTLDEIIDQIIEPLA